MARKKSNETYKELIFNKIAESYPLGIRFSDLEKLIVTQERPNISYMVNALVKEKRIVREKPVKSSQAVYYRLVV